MRKTLAEALLDKIAEKGIKQAGAAAEIGTSEANVSRWITLDAKPDPPMFGPIEKFLKINRAELASLLLETDIRRWEVRQRRKEGRS